MTSTLSFAMSGTTQSCAFVITVIPMSGNDSANVSTVELASRNIVSDSPTSETAFFAISCLAARFSLSRFWSGSSDERFSILSAPPCVRMSLFSASRVSRSRRMVSSVTSKYFASSIVLRLGEFSSMLRISRCLWRANIIYLLSIPNNWRQENYHPRAQNDMAKYRQFKTRRGSFCAVWQFKNFNRRRFIFSF